MMGRLLLLLAFFTIQNLQYLIGQPSQIGLPPIINYSKQDYKAETQNWKVAEDLRGLLYFGNNKGLLEFDGTYWRNFSMPNHTIVRSIAGDSLGRILVGGQDELGYFQADKNGFLVYHSLVFMIPKEYQNFEDIWEILITKHGFIWASQKHLFFQSGDSIRVFTTENRFDAIYSFEGKIYLNEFGEGIKVLKDNAFELISGGEYFSRFEVTSILPYKQQGVLIATRNNGIFHFKEGTVTPWATKTRDYLAFNGIYCAIELDDGKIAIGTSHNGLLILNDEGLPVLSLSRSNGLQNNSVLSLHEDRSHNLWVGLENGISYIEISSPFSWINSDMGVKGTAYSSIIFDDKLYLATNQGVFVQNWSNPPTPLFPDQFELVKNSKSPSWGLFNLDGNLISCQHQGASLIKNDRAIRISPYNGAWKLMQLEKYPNYAVEGSYSGLLLYERKQKQSNWTFKSKLEGFSESSRVMEQDIEGNIWISHPYRGLFRLGIDPIEARILQVDVFDSTHGLPSNIAINVARIKDKILFTTQKGIYDYDASKNEFVPHKALNSLFNKNEAINRLIEDENGTIWFATEEEFGILEIQDQMVEKRVKKLLFNRLRNRLVNGFEHIYAYDKNNIFIGTDEGFILYNPHKNQSHTSPIPLYLREVSTTLGKDSLIFGGSFATDGKLMKKQPESQILSLNPGSHDLRFIYSAPFFEDVNEVKYQVFLEGQDKGWSEWVNKTEKEYTNLSTGEYCFKVRAKGIYGLESEIVSYSFIIQPHWYESLWAKTLFWVIVSGFLIGMILFNRIRLKQKTEAMKLEQAKVLEKKQVEFQQEVQKSEAEIISLRNEKLEAEIMHKNKELASSTMHLVQKGKILLKIKQSLERTANKSSPETRKEIRQISRMIDDDIRLDKNWKQFEYHFDQVHGQFLQHLRDKYSFLTSKDQRLCAYLRMNLSTKEIAQLMNISVRGVEVSRYRLRKKLNLDRDVNLNLFMMNL